MYVKYAQIRDSKGLSDYAVAKGAGVGRSTLSDWKNGLHIPGIPNLQKIADFLGVPISALADNAPDVQRQPSEQELHLLDSWRALDDQTKITLLIQIDALADTALRERGRAYSRRLNRME